MKFNERQVDLVTVRTPPALRYRKFFQSISKIARVHSVTGTVIPTHANLGMNINTMLAYTMLLLKSFRKSHPTIIDINASVYTLLRSNRDLVVDFRTPLPLELAWLGHRNLASLAKRMEKTIEDRLVIAANERMASVCKELCAASVLVIPNYPTRDFKPTVKPKKWKTIHGLAPDDHVVLFTGSKTRTRLKSIYGLDLLLESWKLVEHSADPHLAILGDPPNDYVHRRVRSLNIRHLLLPGKVSLCDLANWINCADVCLAPRTPGFPQHLYDDKDSTKISEYAALEKPIVATGYAPSSQYLLVDQTPEAFAEGIMKGLNGRITPPKPHYWEENESLMLSLLEDFWFR